MFHYFVLPYLSFAFYSELRKFCKITLITFLQAYISQPQKSTKHIKTSGFGFFATSLVTECEYSMSPVIITKLHMVSATTNVYASANLCKSSLKYSNTSSLTEVSSRHLRSRTASDSPYGVNSGASTLMLTRTIL